MDFLVGVELGVVGDLLADEVVRVLHHLLLVLLLLLGPALADSVTEAAICSISAEALWTILIPSVDRLLDVSEISARPSTVRVSVLVIAPNTFSKPFSTLALVPESARSILNTMKQSAPITASKVMQLEAGEGPRKDG